MLTYWLPGLTILLPGTGVYLAATLAPAQTSRKALVVKTMAAGNIWSSVTIRGRGLRAYTPRISELLKVSHLCGKGIVTKKHEPTYFQALLMIR